MVEDVPYFLVGIDPSLTSTGLIILNGDGSFRYAAQITSNNKELMSIRCKSIAEEIVDSIGNEVRDKELNVHCFIEEPGGLLQGPAQDLRTLFWFIVGELQCHSSCQISIYSIAPNTLKKFATGRGNATPADKVFSVINKGWMKLLPEEFHVSDETKGGIEKWKDLYDALLIAKAGMCFFRIDEWTKAQKEAVTPINKLA